MERKRVESRALQSVGYDTARSVLEIEFAGGRVYEYADVPETVYVWLMRVRSKGAYVSGVIDRQYRGLLVRNEDTTPLVELLQQTLDQLHLPGDDQ